MLSYYDINPNVTAFSTTRHGGVSQGNYASMNVNHYCGDNPEHVARNRELLAEVLHVPVSHLIMPHQVHKVESRQITTEFLSLPEQVQTMILEGVDCVMTQEKGVCVGVSTADCIPILLYDPVHHAAAAAHAGWRGTVNRMANKALVDMHTCYDTRPEDVRAVIGPGISVKNFEVGQEVYDAFAQLGNPMDRIAQKMEKWHIDLPLCNRLQLEQAGVKPENIEQSDICTYDHADDYFSYRREGPENGRIYTAIVLS